MPAPTAVTITAPVDVIVAGSRSLTLTCTVNLSPAVNIPVNVTIVWSGPDVMFLPANPVPAVMVSIVTYTSNIAVDVAKNGSYTCQAIVTSGGTTTGTTNITVGMYLLTYCIPASSTECSIMQLPFPPPLT